MQGPMAPAAATPQNETRQELSGILGRAKAGWLYPIQFHYVNPGESGLLTQSVVVELDNVVGRLLTPVTVRLTCVAVSYEALMHNFEEMASNGDTKEAITEVIRRKIEGDVTSLKMNTARASVSEVDRWMNLYGRRVAGVSNPAATFEGISELPRLAHRAAVNFLRRRLYAYATRIENSVTSVTPALLSSTILQRYNAVNNPDDHINGDVNLSIGTMRLPVTGVGVQVGTGVGGDENMRQTDGSVREGKALGTNSASRLIGMRYMDIDGVQTAVPDVWAEFNGAQAGGAKLSDFYKASVIDNFTREFASVRDNQPVYGEKAVLRYAKGLNLDNAIMPFVVYEREIKLNQNYSSAVDGAGLTDEVVVTKMADRIQFSAPIPSMELGGGIITFLEIKPDEILDRVPHPFASRPHEIVDVPQDEYAFDPVPLTLQQVDSTVAATADLDTVVGWTGKNEFCRTYHNYGLSRVLNPDTVENKSLMWHYKIPLGVGPDNITYPAEQITQHPWGLTTDYISYFSLDSLWRVNTPMFFGSTPVEKIDIIDDENILP